MMHRIAVVTHDLSGGGGVGTLTAFLHRVLTASGRYQPEIISLATSATDSASVQLGSPSTWRRGVQIQQREWNGLSYIHVGALGSELELQRYRYRPVLGRLLRQYDLIQFAVGIPAWACAATNVERPVLLWVATTLWADRASRVRRYPLARRLGVSFMSLLAWYFEWRALAVSDFIFATSRYTLEAIRTRTGEGRIALAPCGVDTELFCPCDAYEDGAYILCVARISDPRKNVLLLLEAYAALRQGKSEVPELWLVGDVPSRETGEYLEGLEIADRVRIIDTKGRAGVTKLVRFYQRAMFFALSSNEEGLGIVVIEAMACGLPVVSTRCGGPETTVVDGETGFLTSVGNVQALTAAMQRLLDNPELRRRMGQKGRQVAQEKFSLEVTGKIFTDKYDELLGIRA